MKMSHGLVPSKSTVYISNLPFDLKNNDLHKLFEKYGRIVKVTVLKDKKTRKSRGVAFILFLKREDAEKCVQETDSREMFGRTLKASVAKDNGRSTEFIRRKYYPDKTQCYECGEYGHLSYKCSRNLLGEREPPPKKVRKRKKKPPESLTKEQLDYFESSDDDDTRTARDGDDDDNDDDDETLSAAIAREQEKNELENYRLKVAAGDYDCHDDDTTKKDTGGKKRMRIKKSAYFSDEEEKESD